MISVVIPTLNDAPTLPETLRSLTSAVTEGAVREVIVCDGGSTDATRSIANAMGCRLLQGRGGRGERLADGAKVARGDWLLFLCPDTVLETSWCAAARSFMTDRADGVAAFRFALDKRVRGGWFGGGFAALSTMLSRTPCAEQGLLVARSTYERACGHHAGSGPEHTTLVRRLRRSGLSILPARAVTKASRFGENSCGMTDAFGGPAADNAAGALTK